MAVLPNGRSVSLRQQEGWNIQDEGGGGSPAPGGSVSGELVALLGLALLALLVLLIVLDEDDD